MDNPLGVVSAHLHYESLPEAFQKARRSGLGAIEWFEWGPPVVSEPEQAAEVVSLGREYDVSASYHAPYDRCSDLGLLSPEEGSRRLGDMLVRANRLGARLMTLHLGTHKPSADRQEALDKTIAAIAENVSLAEQLNVRVCVENFTRCHGDAALGVETWDFVRLFDALDASFVGMNLDVGHANITGNLVELVARFGARIRNTHLHDTDGKTDGHLPPGQGTVDWDSVFRLLTEVGYEGPLNFEFPEASGAYPELVARIRSFRA